MARVPIYVWLLLFSLLIGALSLLWPSTPSYDPWSWLIWGREIIHGSLELGGITSWKPLPVMFATVFAVFRGAQPDLWLLVARASMVLSLLMVFRLAYRITWDLAPQSGTSPDSAPGNTGGWMSRALGTGPVPQDRSWQWLPSLIAGLLAAVALLLTGVYFENTMLGYSEALAVAAILIALDCAYDGNHLAAYALALLAALDRPEVFVFMIPYGLWLLWRRPRLRAWVLGLGVLALALWFVPQKIVTGSFSGSVKAAEFVNPGSSGKFPCPFCHEMHYMAWPMAPVQLELMAGLAGVIALVLLCASVLPWRGIERFTLNRRQQALLMVCVAAAFGILWMVLIAFDVQHGFAGNERYMVLGSTLLILAGSIGFGWAANALGAIGNTGGAQRSGRIVAATAVCVCVVLFVPKWIGHRMISIGRTHTELAYQSRLRTDLAALVGRLGPADKLVACGPVVAEHFQIPMVAWYLKVPTTTIQDTPGEWKTWGSARPKLPRGYPNVVVQTSAAIVNDASTGHRWVLTAKSPDAGDIGRWEAAGARYQVYRDGVVTIYKDCSANK